MDPYVQFFGTAPPNPLPRHSGHRRAHSETFLRLPNEILIDPDPDFSIADMEFPSLSDDSASAAGTPIPADSGRSEPSSSAGRLGGGGASHSRSLSVDAAFFMDLVLQGPAMGQEKMALSAGGMDRHRRRGSMDGSTSPFEGESASMDDYSKKAMAADKLAELALIDPRRAKRILANRQSAARSKERKIRYTSELERKVQTLQAEATTLSSQVTLLQRDTSSLNAENRELKLRLQAMEQQAHLHDALNEALREEVTRLKMATGELPSINGKALNMGTQQSASSFPRPRPHVHQSIGSSNHQAHHLHLGPPLENGGGGRPPRDDEQLT